MSDCRRGEGTTLASHIGELKAKGIDVDLITIYIGPSRRMQHLSIQSQINVCSAYGKNILFYMNHGMLHSQKNRNFWILQTQEVLASCQQLNLCTIYL